VLQFLLQFLPISTIYEDQAPKTDIDVAGVCLMLPSNQSLVQLVLISTSRKKYTKCLIECVKAKDRLTDM